MSQSEVYDAVIVGGGASGYFSAISLCELSSENPKVLILEATKQSLQKVKVSGGGRCNITHHCYEPKNLVQNYPRGTKELIGPLHHWGPKEMLKWFQEKGLNHHIEKDGRIFPTTNKSSSVIRCFTDLVSRYKIEVKHQTLVSKVVYNHKMYSIEDAKGNRYQTKSVLLATGGVKTGHIIAKVLGHEVTSLYPSIFTFKSNVQAIKDLSGLSMPLVHLKMEIGKKKFSASGPLLFTHWGISGPAVLRISAFAAKELAQTKYKSLLEIDFLMNHSKSEITDLLLSSKELSPRKSLVSTPKLGIPKRLWAFLLSDFDDLPSCWDKASHAFIERLTKHIKEFSFEVQGRGVFKEEFVTCGGVQLKEVNFKSMESKLSKGLFFAGEVLNIDGVTGGFNFQNAWTTARIAAKGMSDHIDSFA